MKTETRFDIGSLLPIGLTIVVLGIALAYGLQVMGDISDETVADNIGYHCGQNSTNGTGNTLLYDGCGWSYNATTDAVEGVSKIPSKLPMIVTVVVAAVIIGIIVKYLMFR